MILSELLHSLVPPLITAVSVTLFQLTTAGGYLLCRASGTAAPRQPRLTMSPVRQAAGLASGSPRRPARFPNGATETAMRDMLARMRAAIQVPALRCGPGRKLARSKPISPATKP